MERYFQLFLLKMENGMEWNGHIMEKIRQIKRKSKSMEWNGNGKEMEWKNEKYTFGNGMEWKWNGDGNKIEDWYRIEC